MPPDSPPKEYNEQGQEIVYVDKEVIVERVVVVPGETPAPVSIVTKEESDPTIIIVAIAVSVLVIIAINVILCYCCIRK